MAELLDNELIHYRRRINKPQLIARDETFFISFLRGNLIICITNYNPPLEICKFAITEKKNKRREEGEILSNSIMSCSHSASLGTSFVST